MLLSLATSICCIFFGRSPPVPHDQRLILFDSTTTDPKFSTASTACPTPHVGLFCLFVCQLAGATPQIFKFFIGETTGLARQSISCLARGLHLSKVVDDGAGESPPHILSFCGTTRMLPRPVPGKPSVAARFLSFFPLFLSLTSRPTWHCARISTA